MEGVHETTRFITLYGTPALLGLICFYLVFAAFGRGASSGLRSLASVLLPVVIGSCLYVFKRPALERLASVSTAIGFVGGLGMGLVVMAALRLSGQSVVVPLPELLVSGCFSVLVFSSASGSEDRGLAAYYGVMSGLLVYLVILGVPLMK
jgi:hypothetical protein